MATDLLDRPPTMRIHSAGPVNLTRFEPNFGPEDMHAIRAIFGIMVGIFSAALVLYGTIALLAM